MNFLKRLTLITGTLLLGASMLPAFAFEFEVSELTPAQIALGDEENAVAFHAVLDSQYAASLLGGRKFKPIDHGDAVRLTATLGKPGQVAVVVRAYRSDQMGPIFAFYREGTVLLSHIRFGVRDEQRIEEKVGVVFVSGRVEDVVATTRYALHKRPKWP